MVKRMVVGAFVAVLALVVLAPLARAAALEDLDKELTDLAGTVSKSVVTVTSEQKVVLQPGPMPGWAVPDIPGRRLTASGVVYDNAGHIITVASSLPRLSKVSVTLADGKVVPATIVGRDPASNIAVLKVEAPGLVPAKWGVSRDVKPGSLCLAVGSSFGMGPSVTLGVVSAVGRSVAGHADLIQITAPINPGDSGGMLANARGELIGIVTATLGRSPSAEWLDKFLKDLEPKMRPNAPGAPRPQGLQGWSSPDWSLPPSNMQWGIVPDAATPLQYGNAAGIEALVWPWDGGVTHVGSQGMNYALPSDTVKAVADQLIKSGKVSRGWLGVMIEEGATGEPGVVVASVGTDSPAEKAGVKAGDRLLAIGGVKVNSFAELSRTVARQAPGAKVDVTLRRDAKTMTVPVTLGEQREVAGVASGEVEVRPTPAPRGAAPGAAVQRPTLGIQTQTLGEELADALGVKEKRGVLVSAVLAGSVAEKAGIKVGDCIVAIGGQSVTSNEDLRTALKDFAGKHVTVDLVRDKKLIHIQFDLPTASSDTSKRARDLEEQVRKLQEELNALRSKGQ